MSRHAAAFARSYLRGLLGQPGETVDEDGSEAIQFILLAVVLGVGLVVVFAFIRDKDKEAGSRIGSCIGAGQNATQC